MKQLSIFDYDKNGELKEESKYSDLYNKILDIKTAYEHIDKVDFWKDCITETPMWTAMFGDLSTEEGQARYKEYISRMEHRIKQREEDKPLITFFELLMKPEFKNSKPAEVLRDKQIAETLKDVLLELYNRGSISASKHCDIENYLDSFLRAAE